MSGLAVARCKQVYSHRMQRWKACQVDDESTHAEVHGQTDCADASEQWPSLTSCWLADRLTGNRQMDHDRFCRFAGTCTPQQSQPIPSKTGARFSGQAWLRACGLAGVCQLLSSALSCRAGVGGAGSVTERGVTARSILPPGSLELELLQRAVRPSACSST